MVQGAQCAHSAIFMCLGLGKQLTTADNDTIGYEKLIIATGARVRVPVYETMQSLNLGVIIVLVPPLPLRSHV